MSHPLGADRDHGAGGAKRDAAGAWWPRVRRLLVAAVVVLLLPVPWQHKTDSSLGIAWGIDNRLIVQGERLDPPGRFSMLTVGRPPLVAEVAWHHGVDLVGGDASPAPRDLREGPDLQRPVNVTPVAAAAGMAAARGEGPRTAWVEPVDAVLGGHGPPYSWVRSMSMGSSHGLMVGLVTYVSVSGEDLAGGRHVAGTGQLFIDGEVGRIGGLPGKANGARRAGADVLLVPASQGHQLYGRDLGGMQVLEVHSLQDAIDQLRATRDDQ